MCLPQITHAALLTGQAGGLQTIRTLSAGTWSRCFTEIIHHSVQDGRLAAVVQPATSQTVVNRVTNAQPLLFSSSRPLLWIFCTDCSVSVFVKRFFFFFCCCQRHIAQRTRKHWQCNDDLFCFVVCRHTEADFHRTIQVHDILRQELWTRCCYGLELLQDKKKAITLKGMQTHFSE